MPKHVPPHNSVAWYVSPLERTTNPPLAGRASDQSLAGRTADATQRVAQSAVSGINRLRGHGLRLEPCGSKDSLLLWTL